MHSGKHFVSVIVPVFNQWHLVPHLIECLKAQTIPHGSFELVLVDNGSDVLPECSDWPLFMRLFECSRPGSYAARNYGVNRSSGNILAFTDADCLPDPDWLRSIVTLFDEGEQSIVAGHVRITVDEPITPVARYDVVMGFPQERYVARGYGVTANLAVSRALFERLGGFDDSRYSGGDAEFCRRAISHGANLIYCADAVVSHPARRTMDELIRKVRRVKGGQICNGPILRRAQYAARAFLPPLRAWWRIWNASVDGKNSRLNMMFLQGRLWLAEMTETIRLLAGGKPERR
jgi:glycosyltransferase involved in cell wall biosynthesis